LTEAIRFHFCKRSAGPDTASVHPIRPLRSVTFRLALWYGVLFCGSALLLVGFLFWQTTVFMNRQIDSVLRTELATLLGEAREAATAATLSTTIRLRSLSVDGEQLSYLLLDPQGEPIAGNLRERDRIRPLADGAYELRSEPAEGKARRVVRLGEAILNDGHRLYVGLDVADEEAAQHLIAETLATGVVLMIVLAGVGAMLFRTAVEARLQQVSRTSEEIMNGDLSHRIPTTGSGDEFDHLAETLNRMLDEIHTLMESKRNMPNTIAHDLRHPLTRLKAHMEAALAPSIDASRMREIVTRAVTEIDEIVALFNALLRIARIEAGTGRESFCIIAPDEVATEVGEFYQPLAEEKGLLYLVEVEPDIKVFGDLHLLSQAVANLLDNAIKYTPTGGSIRLSVVRVDHTAHITVADSGPGIPVELRPMAVRRFYRLDRSRSTPGHGLGLTLVAAVARLHHGHLLMEDNHPGLRATIMLPLPA